MAIPSPRFPIAVLSFSRINVPNVASGWTFTFPLRAQKMAKLCDAWNKIIFGVLGMNLGVMGQLLRKHKH